MNANPDNTASDSINAASRSASQQHGDLKSFVEGVVGADTLRVEEDLGNGYVRLKSTEAEKRQAIQDIRSSEDIVLEMLRNSRDAEASCIYVALQRDGDTRSIVVIDDGCGIPESMRESIFQPRVTSKLETAHLDKWGIHGRGMALYSIKVNSEMATVCNSAPERGTAEKVVTRISRVPEKTDQSTFPVFELSDGICSMRGPRNLLRTIAEFAFDSRNALDVYCGSPTEIAASLYANGRANIPASNRLFRGLQGDEKLVDMPALAADAEDLTEILGSLGLDISSRSARRIMDGAIPSLPTMMRRIETESFPQRSKASDETSLQDDDRPNDISRTLSQHPKKISISAEDIDAFSHDIEQAYSSLAEKYYLKTTTPQITTRQGKLHITFDMVDGD